MTNQLWLLILSLSTSKCILYINESLGSLTYVLILSYKYVYTYIFTKQIYRMVCQRSWLYLEPIFSSEDINRQLPVESKRYQTMDRMWRKIMNGAKKDPKVTTIKHPQTDATHKMEYSVTSTH